MLQSLFPKAHSKFRALPLLGPVADGFGDWLAARGYTSGSQKFSIRFLAQADADLRKRGVRKLTELSRPVLYDSWRDLIETFPNHAGTVRTLARYLNAVGMIETGAVERVPETTPARVISDNTGVSCIRSADAQHRLSRITDTHRAASLTIWNLPVSRLVPSIPATSKPTSRMRASASAAQVCSMRLPPFVGYFGFSQQMAGFAQGWIARSTLPGFTGSNSCLGRCRGTPSQHF